MAAAMAPLLLLLGVVLFHLPASATLNPVGDLFAKANDTTSPAASAAAAPAQSAVSPGDGKKLQPQQAAAAAPAAGSSKEEREKEMEEIEKEKQEAAETGHLLSFTNGTGAYKGMSHEFLEGHNNLRKRYGVPAMKWNNKLARHARRWSNAMRKDCELKHSAGSNYGENVYVSRDTWNATAKDALWTWINEEPLYDKLTGNCTAGHHYRECGHFKNMVAEKNQKVGCARGECYKGGVFISCNYYFRDFDP